MTLSHELPLGHLALSDNTQAVLLLTSPLLATGAGPTTKAKVLTAGEYSHLAQKLVQAGHKPADLLGGSRDAVLGSASTDLDPARLNLLLSRGFQLGQALEYWANRSITVIGRADDVYPRLYKQRLRHQAPPLLYACGNLELFHCPALAVVGSRNTPESLLQETAQSGALSAAAEVVIASGAAKGVDEAAMLGALQAGGSAIGVVADSLEKMAAKPIWRQASIDRRLLLLSAEAPSARFQVWRAMARNKLIYALADAALVMSSAKGSGGTWEGAKEQLTKLRYCPIHVVEDPRGGEGLPALRKMGAMLWPYPNTPTQLKTTLKGEQAGILAKDHLDLVRTEAKDAAEEQESFLQPSIDLILETTPEKNDKEITQQLDVEITGHQEGKNVVITPPNSQQPATPAENLRSIAFSHILEALISPKTEEELSVLLQLTKQQVKQWCKALIEKGLIKKKIKPVRYLKIDNP